MDSVSNLQLVAMLVRDFMNEDAVRERDAERRRADHNDVALQLAADHIVEQDARFDRSQRDLLHATRSLQRARQAARVARDTNETLRSERDQLLRENQRMRACLTQIFTNDPHWRGLYENIALELDHDNQVDAAMEELWFSSDTEEENL